MKNKRLSSLVSIRSNSILISALVLLLVGMPVQGNNANGQNSTSDENNSPQRIDYSSIDFGDADECEEECAQTGEWQFGLAFGIGELSSPIAGEDDTKLPIIPRFSYYGENFFIDNLTLGYNFTESESFSFDIIAEPNIDFLHFNSASPLQTALVALSISPMMPGAEEQEVIVDVGDYNLEKRKLSYLAGPSIRFRWSDWTLRTNYKTEVYGESDGQEAEIELSYRFDIDKWSFQTSIGTTWKSQDIVAYYYDIAESETPEFFEFLAYSATGSANNPFAKIEAQHDLSERYRLIVSLKREYLDDQIVNSPIVDTDEVNAVFVGIGIEF